MKRLFITIAAIGAIALFVVYCTNNPFDPQHKYTLTVNSNLAVGGTVSPAGTSTRSGGEEVVVTATAAAGYTFTGWSGSLTFATSPVTIIMNGNKTLTANFTAVFNTPSAADFDISGTGTFTHDDTAKIVIVTAKEGKTTGAITVKYDGDTTAPSAVGTYVITFDVAAAIGWTAVSGLFAGVLVINAEPLITYTVTWSADGGTPIPTQMSVEHGGNIAEPAMAMTKVGHIFAGWFMDQNLTIEAEFPITNVTANTTLHARFDRVYTLVVNSNPMVGGTVTVNGSIHTSPTTHNDSDSVAVRAVPTSGYKFTGWSGASISTNPSITITMSDNRTLTANFSQIQYMLTVNRNPTAGGTVTVNGSTYTSPTTHNINTLVTVAAVTASEYRFIGWSGASTSTNAGITVTMDDNLTLTANFQLVVGATGSFTDSRDGKTYSTVVMPDGKMWMSENFNYVNFSWPYNGATGILPSNALGSWCYDNNVSYCNAYGRLYTWEAARVACPYGWRLPTRDDWNNLVSAAGSNAGTKLKAKSTAWDGTDDFGFSALPGGIRWYDGGFGSVGHWGIWRSATEADSGRTHNVIMLTGYSNVDNFWDYKSYGLSIRCVRD